MENDFLKSFYIFRVIQITILFFKIGIENFV